MALDAAVEANGSVPVFAAGIAIVFVVGGARFGADAGADANRSGPLVAVGIAIVLVVVGAKVEAGVAVESKVPIPPAVSMEFVDAVVLPVVSMVGRLLGIEGVIAPGVPPVMLISALVMAGGAAVKLFLFTPGSRLKLPNSLKALLSLGFSGAAASIC